MITIAELIAFSINEDLIAYAGTNATETQKLIDYVSQKVLLYIKCLDQFGDPAVYPNDLKQAVAYLVESLYIFQQGQNEAMNDQINGIRTKKIDDYSVTYGKGKSSFFGIPLDQEIVNIINDYKCDPLSSGYFGTFNSVRGAYDL